MLFQPDGLGGYGEPRGMAEMSAQETLRRLPSVDKVLQMAGAIHWSEVYGHDLVVDAVRKVIRRVRQQILAGTGWAGESDLLARVEAQLLEMTSPTIWPVINATGVILHTNLGRAPLGEDVLAAMTQVGRGYSNLEFDLEAGKRGSRYVHAEALLCHLTGAEAALLVNNNAGAVLLVLSALASGREVIISRGQLVEIGGGFRIPDVMARRGRHDESHPSRRLCVGCRGRNVCPHARSFEQFSYRGLCPSTGA